MNLTTSLFQLLGENQCSLGSSYNRYTCIHLLVCWRTMQKWPFENYPYLQWSCFGTIIIAMHHYPIDFLASSLAATSVIQECRSTLQVFTIYNSPYIYANSEYALEFKADDITNWNNFLCRSSSGFMFVLKLCEKPVFF